MPKNINLKCLRIRKWVNMYYANIINNKLDGCSEFEIKAENLIQIEISEEIFKNIEKYEFKNGEIVLIENFEILKAKEARKEEILNQLKEIDNKSIRALRADEQERLNELEAQAVELRKELQEL